MKRYVRIGKVNNRVLFFWKGKGYKLKLISFSESLIDIILLKYFRRARIELYFNRKNWNNIAIGNWLCPKNINSNIYTSHETKFSRYFLTKGFLLSIFGQYLHLKKNNKISWHEDILSKTEWPRKYFKLLFPVANVKDYSDCKFPWELSRFQHLPSMGKDYIVTKDINYAEEAIWQIKDWIKENPCPYGINWTCAMEVAIRACNWIWAWWAFKESGAWSKEFTAKFLKNMWQHGWYIKHNLENKSDVRTNHYLSDIVGLLFIGIMFPDFKDSEQWKSFGVKELIRCMDEMVYHDGASFENSTAYHRLVLELFTYSAILCKRNNIMLPPTFWERLEKMFDFILCTIRPDGKMPMIGDNDDGRFFILSNYYDWDRWDFRYLLSIGAVLFNRQDFKAAAGDKTEETHWLFTER